MGRRPNPVLKTWFTRGQKLSDQSNRYVQTCNSCGTAFPKGRTEALVRHLTGACPGISEVDRRDICRSLWGTDTPLPRTSRATAPHAAVAGESRQQTCHGLNALAEVVVSGQLTDKAADTMTVCASTSDQTPSIFPNSIALNTVETPVNTTLRLDNLSSTSMLSTSSSIEAGILSLATHSTCMELPSFGLTSLQVTSQSLSQDIAPTLSGGALNGQSVSRNNDRDSDRITTAGMWNGLSVPVLDSIFMRGQGAPDLSSVSLVEAQFKLDALSHMVEQTPLKSQSDLFGGIPWPPTHTSPSFGSVSSTLLPQFPVTPLSQALAGPTAGQPLKSGDEPCHGMDANFPEVPGSPDSTTMAAEALRPLQDFNAAEPTPSTSCTDSEMMRLLSAANETAGLLPDAPELSGSLILGTAGPVLPVCTDTTIRSVTTTSPPLSAPSSFALRPEGAPGRASLNCWQLNSPVVPVPDVSPNHIGPSEQADAQQPELKSSCDPQISGNGQKGDRRKKKRSAFDPQRRLEVQDVRRVGACSRCRALRKMCSPGNPCNTCSKVNFPRVWKTGCIRPKLAENMQIYTASPHTVYSFIRAHTISKQHDLKRLSSRNVIARLTDDHPSVALQVLYRIDGEHPHIVMLDPEDENLAESLDLYIKHVVAILIDGDTSAFAQKTLHRAYRIAADSENESERDHIMLALQLWGWVDVIDRERTWKFFEAIEAAALSASQTAATTVAASTSVIAPTVAPAPALAPAHLEMTASQGEEDPEEPGESVEHELVALDDETYTTMTLQLTATAERNASRVCRKLLNSVQRTLEDRRPVGFPLYLAVVIALHCIGRSMWGLRAWYGSCPPSDSGTCGDNTIGGEVGIGAGRGNGCMIPRRTHWPIERTIEDFKQQAMQLVHHIHLMLGFRSALQHIHVDPATGHLASASEENEAQEYFLDLKLDAREVTELLTNDPFRPDDSRSLDLALCAFLLLPAALETGEDSNTEAAQLGAAA